MVDILGVAAVVILFILLVDDVAEGQIREH